LDERGEIAFDSLIHEAKNFEYICGALAAWDDRLVERYDHLSMAAICIADNVCAYGSHTRALGSI
jgi:CO dehydrogenase/acetyl-CoA synthase alpha subunit